MASLVMATMSTTMSTYNLIPMYSVWRFELGGPPLERVDSLMERTESFFDGPPAVPGGYEPGLLNTMKSISLTQLGNQAPRAWGRGYFFRV